MTAAPATTPESCPGCGFAWDTVDPDEIVPRVRAAVEGIVAVLHAAGDAAGRRPSAERWSAIEYAAHVRDVLLNLRDRLILGAVEDNPTPKQMHADARVALGLYAHESVPGLTRELGVATALFAKTMAALSPDQRLRPIFYGYPAPATRTLGWVAAQALHEVEHHLADVRESASTAG